jgi:uncharacterized protein involved in outer membrane biogenesis
MPERRRRRKWFRISLLIAAAIAAALWISAKTFVPPMVRAIVERAAGQALGRELKITGSFDLSLSLAPHITASDVRLANIASGSEPWMARAERVTVAVELLSLWRGPPRVRDIEVGNARLLLEADGSGRGNWLFSPAPASSQSKPAPEERAAERAPKAPPLVLEHVAIRGLEVRFRPEPKAEPVVLDIEEIEGRLETSTQMIDFRSAGKFREEQWKIQLRVGTFQKLFEGGALDFGLTLKLSDSNLEAKGRIPDLLVLRESELDLSAEGPDLAAALSTFGLETPLSEPFQFRGRFAPEKEGIGVDATATLGSVSAKVRGVLLAIESFRLAIDAQGTDASAIGSWISVGGIPPEPFSVSGYVGYQDGRLSLEQVKTRVGAISVIVSGALGMPPDFVGTDLNVQGSGPDLTKLSKLTTLPLPTGAFQMVGRFLRRADGLGIEAVDLKFGRTAVRAGGNIGEPPEVRNLDLTADLSGPNLSVFSRLLSLGLPRVPFAVHGRVRRGKGLVALDEVTGRLGDSALSGSARLMLTKGLEGTTIDARVAGSDLGKAVSLIGLGGAPAEPFEVNGPLRVARGGFDLGDVDASVGPVSGVVKGHIALPFGHHRTSLSGRVHGPALSDLARWGLPPNLPRDPFSVAGQLEVESGVYRAHGVVASVGPDHFAVDGALGTLPDVSGLDVAVDAKGPSLAGLGRLLSPFGIKVPRRLPRAGYEASGRVHRVPSGYELHEVRAKVAKTVVYLDGIVGSGEHLAGTDLSFRAEATDASLVSDFANTPLPGGAVNARGRLARADSGWLIDSVAVSVGEARAEVSGTLGQLPELTGSELSVKARGPDLSAMLRPLGRTPALPFDLSAVFTGRADRLIARQFTAHLGGSDVEGSLSMRVSGKPSIDADLKSHRVDVGELLRAIRAEQGNAKSADRTEPGARTPARHELSVEAAQPVYTSATASSSMVATAPAETSATSEALATDDGSSAPEPAPTKSEPTRRIPDYHLKLSELRYFDAKLALQVGEFILPGLPLKNIVFAGGLRDGELRVDRLEGGSAEWGRAALALELQPSGQGYRITTHGRFHDVRFHFLGTSPEKAPPFKAEFQLKAEGQSLRQLAASADGVIQVALGPGEISNTREWMSSGIVKSLLDALNPFRKSSTHTNIECAIALATLKAGKTVLEPLAGRTDKLTIVGKGKVDFDTENIEMTWSVKPRTGIGISASSVANPYVKLGGTMSSPEIELKTLEAAASTGAAVATAGVTILLKGFYDRITAEKNVCVNALMKDIEPSY